MEPIKKLMCCGASLAFLLLTIFDLQAKPRQQSRFLIPLPSEEQIALLLQKTSLITAHQQLFELWCILKPSGIGLHRIKNLAKIHKALGSLFLKSEFLAQLSKREKNIFFAFIENEFTRENTPPMAKMIQIACARLPKKIVAAKQLDTTPEDLSVAEFAWHANLLYDAAKTMFLTSATRTAKDTLPKASTEEQADIRTNLVQVTPLFAPFDVAYLFAITTEELEQDYCLINQTLARQIHINTPKARIQRNKDIQQQNLWKYIQKTNGPDAEKTPFTDVTILCKQ